MRKYIKFYKEIHTYTVRFKISIVKYVSVGPKNNSNIWRKQTFNESMTRASKTFEDSIILKCQFYINQMELINPELKIFKYLCYYYRTFNSNLQKLYWLLTWSTHLYSQRKYTTPTSKGKSGIFCCLSVDPAHPPGPIPQVMYHYTPKEPYTQYDPVSRRWKIPTTQFQTA